MTVGLVSSMESKRIYCLDYMRGLVVLLVVLDHAMHGYTRYFADWWFIQDYERSDLLDIFHLHNDAIMMPLMFFLAGLFVLPSLEKRGLVTYLKERCWRLGVPLIVGVLFIAPCMNYHKKVAGGYGESFLRFWKSIILDFNTYPLDKANAAGFWFLTYLILLTGAVIICYRLCPPLRRWLKAYAHWILQKPMAGIASIVLIVCSLNLISEWLWGGAFWFVVPPFLGVRKGRFLAKAFFFLLGIALADAGFLKDPHHLKRLKNYWLIGALIAFSILSVYVFFVLEYINEGVFNMPLVIYKYYAQAYPSWEEAWKLISTEGILSSCRAALLGMVMVTLGLFYLSFFSHFLNKPTPFWQSLASCSYGIYIFHEPLITAVNISYLNDPLSGEFKFIIAAAVSLIPSWLAVHYMLKIPFLKRIIG